MREIIAAFCDEIHDIQRFGDRLRQQTGTRLIDWVDHFALPASDCLESRLEQTGFLPHDHVRYGVWDHPGGLFPQVVTHPNPTWRLAVRVESVADFLAAQGLEPRHTRLKASRSRHFERLASERHSEFEFWVVERHGYRGWETSELTSGHVEAVLDYDRGVWAAVAALRRSLSTVSQRLANWSAPPSPIWGPAVPPTCSSRPNAATGPAAIAPPDSKMPARMPLVWAGPTTITTPTAAAANTFCPLIGSLEDLGLVCRERFYAGREAGWGAQVLEQEESQVVVFADVDLSAAEVCDDFAHAPLSPAGAFRHRRTVVPSARRGIPRAGNAPSGVPIRFRRRPDAVRSRRASA